MIDPGKNTMKKDPMYDISSIQIIAINKNKSFEQLQSTLLPFNNWFFTVPDYGHFKSKSPTKLVKEFQGYQGLPSI